LTLTNKRRFIVTVDDSAVFVADLDLKA
jgi:hypothetical protein